MPSPDTAGPGLVTIEPLAKRATAFETSFVTGRRYAAERTVGILACSPS